MAPVGYSGAAVPVELVASVVEVAVVAVFLGESTGKAFTVDLQGFFVPVLVGDPVPDVAVELVYGPVGKGAAVVEGTKGVDDAPLPVGMAPYPLLEDVAVAVGAVPASAPL